MATAITTGDFQVQRAGLKGEWKTVCSNPSLEYAEDIYQKQLKYSCIGRFRLLGPDQTVIKFKELSLFN